MMDVKKLQKRLRAINAAHDAIKAQGERRTDSDKREALMQTLDAVIEHLEAQPGCKAADTTLLWKLAIFLYDAQNGHHTSWAEPKVGHRPKGKPLGIMARRAVAAADLQKLLDGGVEPDIAARQILEECAPGLSKDRRQSKRAVARWRENVMTGPSDRVT